MVKGETFDMFFLGNALKKRGRERGVATSELRVFVVVHDSAPVLKHLCLLSSFSQSASKWPKNGTDRPAVCLCCLCNTHTHTQKKGKKDRDKSLVMQLIINSIFVPS